MVTIDVVHVSDLHYGISADTDKKIIVEALLRDIKELRNRIELQPELIVFTGDLVQAGSDAQMFELADSQFIKPLLDACNLDRDRLYVAPGNHDIDRAQVAALRYVTDGLLNRLSSVDATNAFFDEVSAYPDRHAAVFDRLKNFNDYRSVTLPKRSYSNPFVEVDIKEIKDCKLGVACFNTAWLATGEGGDKEKRRLILGERAIDNSIERMSSCDIRIAAFLR